MTTTDTEATSEILVVTPDALEIRQHRFWRAPRRGDQPVPAKQAKPRRPLSQGTVGVLWTLLSLGLLAVWFVSYAVLFSDIEQGAAQRQLYAEFREQLANATAPLGGPIERGSPVALMQAPTLGLTDQIVVEGTAAAQTALGPGHRSNTPLPGQVGVSVLYGRGVSFGAPFAQLGDQYKGEQITMTTAQGEFVYSVTDVRRAGDPLPKLLADGQSRLTLVSVETSGVFQGFAADSTVYLDATLIGKTVDSPAGRPTAVAVGEEIMAGDKTALMPLVLWLQALLVVSVAVVWARVRWGGWQTWVVGVPVVVAVLWGTTGTVFLLLPNLL